MAVLHEVTEKTSSRCRMKIWNLDDDPIIGAQIASMTMSIYERDNYLTDDLGDPVYINEWDHIDVYNEGAWDKGVTVETVGEDTNVLQIMLGPSDNIISVIANQGSTEIHMILIEGTTVGNATFRLIYKYEVKDAARVV